MRSILHLPPEIRPPLDAYLERNHRILVVDDNEAIHEDFRKILSANAAEEEFDAEQAEVFGGVASVTPRVDFEMTFAAQGAEALELVQAARQGGQRYALVFMDVRIPPGWDGLETAVKLWEVDPDLQIVICTAYSDRSWEEMMQKLGSPERVLILKKPFDPIEVTQLAHALTEKWSLLQASRRNLEDLECTVSLRTRELQAAHRELQTSEQRYRALSSCAPIGIYETDADGACLYTNPHWRAITGLSLAESLGAGWQQAIHPEDVAGVVAAWESYAAGGIQFEREFRIRNQAGDSQWVDSRAVKLRSESGEVLGHVGTIRDVTDRKKVEAELSRARDAALESAQLKARFLANMSHEIRTPMNGIIGLTELVLGSELNPQQRQYLDMTKSSAHALLGLINDILDFSKIEAGKLELEAISFSLRDCLGGTLKPLGVRAGQKGLELTVEIPAQVPDHFVGDPMRLRQILTNLTDNAIKFTQQGEVMVSVETESATENDQILHFCVADTGAGIPSEKQAMIFEAFAQADGTTTRTYGGTGLGLAIASDLVRKMDGRIWVESKVGEGTAFHFTARFPVRQTPAPHLERADPRQLEGLHALVVDDNAINRRILGEMLMELRMQPKLAESGAAALGEMRRAARAGTPFGLVLLDATMPGMDGLAVIEKVERDPELSAPTVMMVASPMPAGASARCRELGVVNFLTKPVGQSELLEAILSALGGDGAEPLALSVTSPVARVGTSLRILLAEDNLINRVLATGILEKGGHTLVHAATGHEAVEAARDQSFDLIFMDVQMPDMDGFEATRRIREREQMVGRHTPIVAMTANAMKGDRERCLAIGMDEYLSKPLHHDELLELLARIQEAHAPREPCSATLPRRVSGGETPPLAASSEPWAHPIFSREKLLAQLGGNEELLQLIVVLFNENTPRLMDHIRGSLERRAAAGLAGSAHRLLSSLTTFGAAESYRLAQRLEELGRSETFIGADETFAELERETERVCAAIERLI